MDNLQQFARDCADFLKDKVFATDLKPDELGRRIDVVVYLLAQNLLIGAPQGGNIEYLIMGTKGGGGPHRLLDLLHYLKNQKLPELHPLGAT